MGPLPQSPRRRFALCPEGERVARPWRLFFGSAWESHARCFEKQQLVSFLGPPARSRDETSACFLIDVGVAFSSGSVTSAPCVRRRALGQSHASRAGPPARRLSPSPRRLRGVAVPPPNKARRPRFLPFQSALFVFRLRHPCRPSGHQDALLLFPAEGFAGSPFTLRSPVPRAL